MNHEDQQWEFVDEGWDNIRGEWRLVGCHQNGGVGHTYSMEWSTSNGVTETEESSITTAISSGFSYAGVEVSAEVATTSAHSLAVSFESTTTTGISVTRECENWPNGDPVVTYNCMWQWSMEGTNELKRNSMDFSSSFTVCTEDIVFVPQCIPGTRCIDRYCQQCAGTGLP